MVGCLPWLLCRIRWSPASGRRCCRRGRRRRSPGHRPRADTVSKSTMIEPASSSQGRGALTSRAPLCSGARSPDIDLVVRDDCRLTSRGCTVVDCALLLGERAGMRFIERALQRDWISYEELTFRVQRCIGRHGVEGLVRTVRALGSGARSDTERRLVDGLRARGIGGWQCNVTVADGAGLIGIVDVAFSAIKLAIELDGRAWHVDRDRFQHDRTRQNRLVADGWTVLRFTWEDVRYRLGTVLAGICAAVARLTSR